MSQMPKEMPVVDIAGAKSLEELQNAFAKQIKLLQELYRKIYNDVNFDPFSKSAAKDITTGDTNKMYFKIGDTQFYIEGTEV